MNLSSVLIACLALGVIVHGQPNPGFISIDCGAPDNYYDNSLGINYLTDASFVDSGETSRISSYFLNAYSQKQSQNLRSFPNGARNCYTLRPSQGKGNRYLIRASFWYGNYDGKNQTPIFDLHIDVNYWRTVITNVSQYQEIIYTPTRDYIQVCLVNTNLGVPFISALELRLLNNSIYQIDSGSLVLAWRYNLGSSTTYRHPQDNYDRIWSANDYNSSWPSISNTTDILTSGSNDAYDVPPQVLMSAEQVKSPSDPLFVSWPSTNSDTSELMYFHFAELDLLQNGQLREFTVYSDQFLATVTLENLKPVTVVSLPTNASNFTINATARSTLPPLLNAIEIYLIRPLPNLPTSLYDFNAINDIKKSYGVDRDTWQGDPCVPQTYAWIGLNCSYAGSSRIISLDLSSSGLTGSISNSFANLTAITSVNLSNNQLNGQLPNFLAQMPSLKILDLSGNKLTGSIPQALMKKKADGTLQLSLDGNPDLCQSNSCSEQQPSGTKTILIAIGVLLIVLSGLAAIWIIKRRKAGRGGVTNTNRMFRTHNKNRPVTSLEVARITDNFREVIGEGGFGKVYHGVLDEGTQVAVKLLSRSSKQGYKEFQAEAQLLMIVHHRNLVSLVGYCDEFENMALIYEFMSNGNVRQHLLGERGPNVLSWTERLQIAIDAAQGLEYLHNGCKPPIIHRDLKTVNILLDENMRAKIADFGLSKAFVTDFDSHISTRPSGTPGYLDPEFHTSGNLSKKSDVYGFGIVLFELITGQAAIIRSQEGYVHILEWVTPLIERGDIQSVVDPRLHGSFNIGSAWKAVETAISCVPSRAIQRPDIGHVLSELKQCLASEVGSGRSQRLGNSKRGDAFEITSLELDRSTPNPR